NLENEHKIIENAKIIKARTKELAIPGSESYELIVGKANTSSSIKDRIQIISDVITEVVNG
ncbi:TPA: hypothetical protein ACN7I5_002774, partial [Klebsiella pneumoniae]